MAALAVILAIGLLVWLQTLLYRTRWSKNTELTLSFSQRCATEGDRLYLNEVITNRKLLPLPWLAVKFQVSRHLRFDDSENAKVTDDYYRNDLFNLLMFTRITRRLSFVCGKRGYYTVKSADLISGDALALEKYTRRVPCRADLTVFPQTLALEELFTVHRQFLGRLLTKRYREPDPFEFKGIREYQPQDSLRTVNFKATAKTGDLMVNMYDYTVSQEVVLVLNTERYSAFPNEALYEYAIRLAASLAAYYIQQGVPLAFTTNARGVDFDEPYLTADTRTPAVETADTRTPAVIDGGSGANHLVNIYTELARIDLRREVVCPGHALLSGALAGLPVKRRSGREPAYILISTSHGQALADAYAALSGAGAEALWFIPVTRGMDVTVAQSDKIIRTEMG